MYIVMFESSILNQPIINDLSNICLNVSCYLYFFTMIAKLCFEKVSSIAPYSSLFCLITIFIFVFAIAVFMIKKNYDYIKGALLQKKKGKKL